jgi:malate dehydrogenase (oxaloacetate-decarboxylating)
MPVMEGKAVLFKAFGGVDGVPITLDTQDPTEIVETVGPACAELRRINLEDISAPRCFEIEDGSSDRSTSRSSTTTSTAPPWSALAALENALRLPTG